VSVSPQVCCSGFSRRRPPRRTAKGPLCGPLCARSALFQPRRSSRRSRLPRGSRRSCARQACWLHWRTKTILQSRPSQEVIRCEGARYIALLMPPFSCVFSPYLPSYYLFRPVSKRDPVRVCRPAGISNDEAVARGGAYGLRREGKTVVCETELMGNKCMLTSINTSPLGFFTKPPSCGSTSSSLLGLLGSITRSSRSTTCPVGQITRTITSGIPKRGLDVPPHRLEQHRWCARRKQVCGGVRERGVGEISRRSRSPYFIALEELGHTSASPNSVAVPPYVQR